MPPPPLPGKEVMGSQYVRRKTIVNTMHAKLLNMLV